MNKQQTSKGTTVKKKTSKTKAEKQENKIPDVKKEPEMEAKKEPAKKKSITRTESIFMALQNAGGTIALKELSENANKIYVDAGKKDNILESKFTQGYFVNTLICFKLGTVKDGILSITKHKER
jgi:hypothetical protein